MDTAQSAGYRPPSSASDDPLRRLFLLAIVLWCAIPLSPQSPDSDLWGHARYGWDTWHRGLAHQSTYTYTAVGYPWINHENLSELIMAWGAFAVGPTSLLVIKCLLGCAVLWLGILRNKRAADAARPLMMGVVCVVVALNLSFYWGLRPHVFTFVLFAILIALVDSSFDGWSGNWHLYWPGRKPDPQPARIHVQQLHRLWFAPILLGVWANTHGGFLAGLAVFVAMICCRAGEVLWVEGPKAWRICTYLALIAVAGALATLVNPYGIDLHRWLVNSLSVPRPEIQEWHPPAWFGAGAIKLWIMLAMIVWGLLASKRPRDATQLVILGLVGLEAVKHQRHLPFVAILFLFWLPEHLQSACDRFLATRPFRRPSVSPALARAAGVGLLLLCGLLAYRVGSRLSGVPVSNYEYPVDALQFMSDQGLTGRLVVEGHWAQYALGVMGAYAPGDAGLSVAFDGRFRTCYPQQVVDMYFDFFVGDGGPDKRFRSPQSPAADPERILEFGDPQLVLINRHGPHAVGIMTRRQDKWVLLYQDQLAQLWGRRSLYDRRNQVEYVAPERRRVAAAHPPKHVPWPAAPSSHRSQSLALSSASAVSWPSPLGNSRRAAHEVISQ